MKPTIEEAADWLCKALTSEYRHACLAHWRKIYGDQYAYEVEKIARKHFSKKNKVIKNTD